MILVTCESFDPTSIDWRYIDEITLVNYGQEDYKEIKSIVASISRANIFNEIKIQAIFPPLNMMTESLLLELAKTYNQEGMVIFNGNVRRL